MPSKSTPLVVVSRLSSGHAASRQQVRHLVALDASLPDVDVLLRHLPYNSLVCQVPQQADALAHLAQAAALLPRGSLHGLHILGHGQPGRMQLGSGWVDARTVQEARDAMNDIASALADDAHIWLYGCHSAQGQEGTAWLDAWALATGAAVHGTAHTWIAQHPALLHQSTASAASNPLQSYWQASGWAHALGWHNQTPVRQSYSDHSSGEFRNNNAFAAFKADGTVVTWGNSGFGGDSSKVVTQLTKVKEVFSNQYAFAALKTDGTVVTWGYSAYGGDSSGVAAKLTNVEKVFSSTNAFAALKADGTVVTWGDSRYGGDSSGVEAKLTNVQEISSWAYGFAALKTDGTVVYWGAENSAFGIIVELTNVQEVFSNLGAMAALKDDGTVVTWGIPNYGGDSSGVVAKLTDVQQVFSSRWTFAALKVDGTLVTWGDSRYGGDSSGVTAQLTNVKEVFSSHGAMAALKDNGTVVAWGNSGFGGDSSGVAAQLTNVQQVFSTATAFAALKTDGTVVTWGNVFFDAAGNSADMYARLTNIKEVFSTTNHFAALKNDGTAFIWERYGHIVGQFTNVEQVFTNSNAFVFLKDDGTVVTWGYSGGGDSTSVTEKLIDVVGISTILTDDDWSATWVTETTAPTVSDFHPADEATGVAVDSHIVVTFSEYIALGTGSIVLKETITDLIVATYHASSSIELSIAGNTLTIDPSSNLVHSTGYKVEFAADSIKDLAGNAFAGTTSYNFTTAVPTDTTDLTVTSFSPADEALSVAVDSPIVVTFSKDIARGTGSIALKDSTGFIVAVYDAESSSNLLIAGNTLIIDPSSDLAYGTVYKVEFAANSIKDLVGNAFAGTTSYNFTTATAATPGLATMHQNINSEDLANYIKIGALFSILSYGDGALSSGTFASGNQINNYKSFTDEGFNDNYNAYFSENPQLGRSWEIMSDNSPSTLAWSNSWAPALDSWQAEHSVHNDSLAAFTTGGLYNAYIDIGISDPFTNDQKLTIEDYTKYVKKQNSANTAVPTDNDSLGDSNALLAQSFDSNGRGTLVLTFRGTDDFDTALLGGQTWQGNGEYLHYEAFRPLIEAAYLYAGDDSNNIDHIIVSGHSLGGLMVDIFTLVDARRFAALNSASNAMDLTIVSIASPGIRQSLLTESAAYFGISQTYDQSFPAPQSPSSPVSTATISDFYHGFAHQLDRVYFAEKKESTTQTTLGHDTEFSGWTTGLNGNWPIEENSNFNATVLNLPKITNWDVTYTNLYDIYPYPAQGFGAHHNGQIYYEDINALYSSPLRARYYETQQIFFGRGFITGSGQPSSFKPETNPQMPFQLDDWIGGSDQNLNADPISFVGDDFILGLEGNDVLAGREGSDLLDGGSGNDILYGGEHDDVLYGGKGNDKLVGGNQNNDSDTGEDFAVYPGSYLGYDVELMGDLSTGFYYTITDTQPLLDGDEGKDELYNIDNLVFEGKIRPLYYAFAGKVADGYIAGAAIYIDIDGDGIADAEEATGVVTDSQGNFALETNLSGALIAIGGTNIDTGLANTLILSAPAGSTIITPLTTLVHQVARLQNLDASAAETLVQNALGLSADVDLNQYDPLAQSATDAIALAVQKLAAQVAAIVTLAPQGGTSFTSIAAALVSAGQQIIDLTDPAVLQAILPGETAATLEQAAAINRAIDSSDSLDDISAIQQAALNDSNDAPLVLAALADQHTTAGAAYSFTVADTTFIDLDVGDTLSFSASLATGSPLPTWLSFNAATRTFGSTPGALDAGDFDLKVTATDTQDATASDVFRLTVTSSDIIAPTVATFSPADEATSVAIASNIVITFSEAIARGTGNIVLKTAAGVTVASLDAASSGNLSLSGNTLTINPTANLGYSTGYKFEFAPGSVKDLAGNPYAGSTDYNLTTATAPDTSAPTVTSFNPLDEAASVAIASNIVVTFSEAIAQGSGSIVLKTGAGVTVESFDAASSSNLSLSGNTLTINPTADLGYSTGYKFEFAPGSVKDLAGNPYAGSTDYSLTTAATTTPVVVPTGSNLLVAIQASTGVTLNPVLRAVTTAKLQQLVDNGTFSALSASIAIQAFSTEIKLSLIHISEPTRPY